MIKILYKSFSHRTYFSLFIHFNIEKSKNSSNNLTFSALYINSQRERKIRQDQDPIFCGSDLDLDPVNLDITDPNL